MEMCDDGHDEIVYEYGKCPICEIENETEELEGRIENLEEEVDERNNIISDLELELEEAQENCFDDELEFENSRLENELVEAIERVAELEAELEAEK